MTEIIPAVLESNFESVSKRLDQVVGEVQTVQIDICDGVFVPSITWPFVSPYIADKSPNFDVHMKAMITQEEDMPHWEELDFELDLMVSDAKKLIPDLLAMGPARILFHAEAFTDLLTDMFELREMIPEMVEIGLAINAGTNPEILFPVLDEKLATSVQCMGISKIGYQGQPFDERVLTNLATLRAKYPTLALGVDGAVTLETAPKLVKAGANRLASGSGIFAAPDIAGRITQFKDML